LSDVVFIVENEATLTKIIVDGSRTGHEVRQVRCRGVDEVCGEGAEAGAPGACIGVAGRGHVTAQPDPIAAVVWTVECSAVCGVRNEVGFPVGVEFYMRRKTNSSRSIRGNKRP
jgi:hypothetical protein